MRLIALAEKIYHRFAGKSFARRPRAELPLMQKTLMPWRFLQRRQNAHVMTSPQVSKRLRVGQSCRRVRDEGVDGAAYTHR
jgi:hypothetical protein